jgi:CMP-N-acetylneuraminic acid synthetase
MLAILPIRAGSQRVKHKNIRMINGKPLYIYMVDTLKKVEQIEKILINTDYQIIHNAFSNDSKVDVMARDEELRDNCNINLVIDRVLKSCKYEYFLQTHVTNPLLKASTINDAIVCFKEQSSTHDSLFSVTKVQKRFWSSNTKPLNHSFFDEPTTQNLEPYYEENSCLYVFSRESFDKNKNRLGTKPIMYEIPKDESWDIDDEEDMQLVVKLMS